MKRLALPALGASLALLSSGDARAFRFVCNGINADGTVVQDGCAQYQLPCDAPDTAVAVRAPRWVPAILNFTVDNNTVPSGVSSAQWQSIVSASMDAWNQVSGSTLSIHSIPYSSGPQPTRQFGADTRYQELFWIVSAAEWQSKVGGGINGALGVTLPNYDCGTPGNYSDADLALNGVPSSGFCWNSANCYSVQATLVHELGHAFGLGHPCDSCAWAAMSAQAFAEPLNPLFDDQKGVRSLYPGTPGGIGYGCNGNGDCNGGLCITANTTNGTIKYCSQTCGTCPAGFTCETVGSQGMVCTFAGGQAATPVGVGENCAQRSCEAGLQCAGSGNDYRCYQTCTPPSTAGCAAMQECLALTGGGGVCVTTSGNGQVGDVCNNTALCATDLVCIVTTTGATSGNCKRKCTPPSDAGCGATEYCAALQNGGGACLLDDRSTDGQVCTTTGCKRGLACIIDQNPVAHCYVDCAAQPCPANKVCNTYNGGTASEFKICEVSGISSSSSSSSSSSGGTSSSSSSSSSSGGTSSSSSSSGGSSGSAGFGEACGTDNDCQNSLSCISTNNSRICVSSCDPRKGHYDCPDNSGCVANNWDDLTQGGRCLPGHIGSGANGSACNIGEDCEYGICNEGKCTIWCGPGGSCATGYVCDQSVVDPGVCKPTGSSTKPLKCNCLAPGESTPWAVVVGAVFVLLGRRRKVSP